MDARGESKLIFIDLSIRLICCCCSSVFLVGTSSPEQLTSWQPIRYRSPEEAATSILLLLLLRRLLMIPNWRCRDWMKRVRNPRLFMLHNRRNSPFLEKEVVDYCWARRQFGPQPPTCNQKYRMFPSHLSGRSVGDAVGPSRFHNKVTQSYRRKKL